MERPTQLLDKLRSQIPNVDELWDPTLPLSINIARIVSGDATRALEARQRQRNPRQAQAAEYQTIVHALSTPEPHGTQSPLLALQQQLFNVFRYGPLRAGGVFRSLSDAALCGDTEAETPVSDNFTPWNSCKAAATLVGLLACPADRVHEVFKFQSSGLQDLPTLQIIRNTPSASLLTAFRNAKALARGAQAKSSVIMVSLVDVHIFELAELGKSQGYTSFAHVFVLGIGPKGVTIWQGWGEHGYGLDEWIDNDGSRVQSWQEAGDFVDVFEKFAAYQGKWDSKRNKLYKKCFDVDILQICGAEGPSRPIVPGVESWVRLLVMDDVNLNDIYKFTFQ